ncbi:MAG: hypothetical protein WBC44_09955 [Planctomycetaceae bacterium]
MSFAFTDGVEINKPKNILKGVMGARGILGKVKGQAYLNEVRQWAAAKSRTAQRILKTIDDFPHPVYLVAMDGGFTCFDNEPLPGGVIYMDVNIKVSVNPGGARGMHAGFEKLHPFIVFLHECGHAVQNIENPSQFANHAKGPLSALTSDIATAARQRGDRLFSNMPYVQRKVWFASNGPVTGQAWAVRLEYDNVFRHERPICVEAGEPLRDHYNDIRTA